MPILISLSAFGADEVKYHGQLGFAQLAAQAGADGIEVRAELLRDTTAPGDELSEIAQALPGLHRVYSSPQPLCCANGLLDAAALEWALSGARQLQAQRLKMSLGREQNFSVANWAVLRERLRAFSIELLVENDQTEGGGTLRELQCFFSTAQAHGLNLGMTFDIGNWHWAGECPQAAAQALAETTRYVHTKGVQRQPQRWVAVPINESAAPWRTILRTLPTGLPWAIEYPLCGEDLLAVTRQEVERLRLAARLGMAA